MPRPPMPGPADVEDVFERVEMMIQPDFDMDDLPQLAADDALLPWAQAAVIEPTFDTEGLPTVAGGPDPRTFAAGGSTEGDPGSTEPAGLAALPPPAPLPPPSHEEVAESMARDAVEAVDADAQAEIEAAEAAASGSEEPNDDAVVERQELADWDPPAPEAMAAEQLPVPTPFLGATEPLPIDRPEDLRKVLMGALAVVVLVAVLLIAFVIPGGDDARTVEVGGGSNGGTTTSIPLVLPAFTPVEHPWKSMTAVYESTAGDAVDSLELSGPASHAAIRALASERPVGATTALRSTETIVTDEFAYTAQKDEWERTPEAKLGVYDLYTRMTMPRSFEDVVPSSMRPLVDVISVSDDPATGLRRYELTIRMSVFAEQYPADHVEWSEINAWSSDLPDSVEMSVDVDETGLVHGSVVSTVDGTVSVTSSLSQVRSSVTVPEG